MKSIRTLWFLISILFSISHAQEIDYEIHHELRTLLKGIETAINEEKYTELKQYFHKNLRVTTVNQNTITTHEGIEKYFNEWFGEGGYLVSLQMTLTPDTLTELYSNKTMGIVRGSGIEKYKLTDGRKLDLKTRWTATVIKSSDGKWRILSLHLGTNFYDNAIYYEMKDQLTQWGILGSLFALLFGVSAGYFLRRYLTNR
jgi:ketosteroid isomerase-like protein